VSTQPAGKIIEIPSRRFGRYLVRSKLGAGGMAEVFLAEAVDAHGDQVNVALKLMREGGSEEQFADEADLMGLLSHPNLVERLEIGQAFGRPYIAMEFLVGGDLRGLMESHRRQLKDLPTLMGVHVVLEVLKGLAYFHQAKTKRGTPLGLVHGDVNPENVFFSGSGEVKLGDFGVTKIRSLELVPGEGVTAGKLSYLSPEQTRGEPLTPSSDIWAAGVMLYELTVGYHPFLPREQLADLNDAQAQKVMAVIRAGKVTLPDYLDRPLAAILARALAPDPKLRYRTAGEFAGQLFQHALDANLCQTPRDIQVWLESVLGLLV
jgi:serine/threonine protein kinase